MNPTKPWVIFSSKKKKKVLTTRIRETKDPLVSFGDGGGRDRGRKKKKEVKNHVFRICFLKKKFYSEHSK